MTLQIQPAFNGARGVDTILTFNAERAKTIKQAGFNFVVRYLGSLTKNERDIITGEGLGLLAVTYSRRAGWIPSADLGTADGAHAVINADNAGLLPGMSLYIDIEGPSVHGDCISYINNCASKMQSADFRAGMYVGWGIPLNSYQLYHALRVTGYWHSVSWEPPVDVRGYQMTQEYPPNQHVAGLQVDKNHIETDGRGDTPHWLIDV
ncbi:Uncharacterised protein [uncultured archaeon]|nr:Uncharacterised protein [uncultured archaeon]